MEICMLCSGGCHGTSFYEEQSVLLARWSLCLRQQLKLINQFCLCLLNAALDVYRLLKWIIMTEIGEGEDVGETESEKGVCPRDDL